LEGALKMAFEIKQPKKREKKESIFELPEEKEEKQDDIFKVPDNKDEEEETKLFQMEEDKDQFIQDLNDDLSADGVPIKVKNKYTLIIKAGGQDHKITRKNIAEFNRKYALEDGSESRPYTAFRTLGSINGERNEIDNIYKESNKIFGEIDEHTGSFRTLPTDEW
jgi:hypothetical protein